MNEKLEKLFQIFYMKFPVFRPILHSLYGKFLAHYTFSGWGMKTVNELPWKGNLEQDFRKDCIDIKELFEQTNVQAVGASSIFNFTQYTPMDIKNELNNLGIPVRI